jgi:hypothetical protein
VIWGGIYLRRVGSVVVEGNKYCVGTRELEIELGIFWVRAEKWYYLYCVWRALISPLLWSGGACLFTDFRADLQKI